MLVGPRVIRNVGSFLALSSLHFQCVLFSGLEASTSFSDVTPRAVSTGDLVNYISLKVNRWRKFW